MISIQENILIKVSHCPPGGQCPQTHIIYSFKLFLFFIEKDKSDLVMDAIYRAQEYNHRIEMDDFMKEVVYGYRSDEKHITQILTPITYVSEESPERTYVNWNDDSFMSSLQRIPDTYNDFER